MPSVIAAFAHAMARAVDLSLSDDGAFQSGDTALYHLPPAENGRISDADYFDLIDWICTRHGDDAGLVAAYARTIAIDDLGVLGLAIKTAPTLRDSLQRIERYFRLVTDNAVYRLQEEGEMAHFAIQALSAPRKALQLRNECALAGLASNLRDMVGTDLQFDTVTFGHDCRSDPAAYAAIFGCPVQFGGAEDAIVLRRDMLDLPNRLGDRGVSQFLTAHLDSEIRALPETETLHAQLLRILSDNLSNGLPAASEIARSMGMSERTFYRRLSDEGMSFRDVLREAQSELAQQLLSGSDCSIAEVAFLTGFAEQSAFSRAFKRWVGLAPAQFRLRAQ